MIKQLFEEARYCYAYGQFLATVLLGLAYIERTIAAETFAAGDDSARNTKAVDLFKKAFDRGYLTNNEYKLIERCRRIRNAVVHFRKPLEADLPEVRSVKEGTDI